MDKVKLSTIILIVLRRKKLLYLVLLSILGVMLYIYLHGVSDNLIGNLLTEIVGICITVFILDFIIALNEENRNYKIGRLALLQVRWQLSKLLELLRDQLKSVHASALASVYSTDLFTETTALEICSQLNPDARCPVIYEIPITWERHNALFAEQFRHDLDLIIDKFLLYLPEDMIEDLERLKNSEPFCFYMVSRSHRASLKKSGILDRYLHGMEDSYLELFQNFTAVEVELMDFGLDRVE